MFKGIGNFFNSYGFAGDGRYGMTSDWEKVTENKLGRYAKKFEYNWRSVDKLKSEAAARDAAIEYIKGRVDGECALGLERKLEQERPADWSPRHGRRAHRTHARVAKAKPRADRVGMQHVVW